MKIIFTMKYFLICNLISKRLLFHSHQFTNNVIPCRRRDPSNSKNGTKSFNTLIRSIASTTVVIYITWAFTIFNDDEEIPFLIIKKWGFMK